MWCFKTPFTRGLWLIPLSDLAELYNTHTMWFVVLNIMQLSHRDSRHVKWGTQTSGLFLWTCETVQVFSRCICLSASGLDGKYQWVRREKKILILSCGANYDWTVLWRWYGFVIWTHHCIVLASLQALRSWVRTLTSFGFDRRNCLCVHTRGLCFLFEMYLPFCCISTL